MIAGDDMANNPYGWYLVQWDDECPGYQGVGYCTARGSWYSQDGELRRAPISVGQHLGWHWQDDEIAKVAKKAAELEEVIREHEKRIEIGGK